MTLSRYSLDRLGSSLISAPAYLYTSRFATTVSHSFFNAIDLQYFSDSLICFSCSVRRTRASASDSFALPQSGVCFSLA